MSGRLECVDVWVSQPNYISPGMDALVISGRGLANDAPDHFYVGGVSGQESVAGKLVAARNSSLKAREGPGTVVIEAATIPTSWSTVRTSFTYTWVAGKIPDRVEMVGGDSLPESGVTSPVGSGDSPASGRVASVAGATGDAATDGAASASAPPNERTVFSTSNDGGVSNGGKAPSFALDQPTTLTYAMTYHWNGGSGVPGGGTIGLLSEDVTLYGPWP